MAVELRGRFVEAGCMIRFIVVVVVVMCVSLSTSVLAGDLFQITAISATDPSNTVTAGGSSVVDLIENLVESESQFRSLENQGFSATLNYAGVKDAVRISRNAAGTSATVVIPSTGLNKTFTGDNEDDVNNQIEEWVRQDGANEWAEFLQAVNEASPVAVNDGNPLATTALLADTTYERFGITPSPLGGPATASLSGIHEFRLDISGGFADSGVGDGFFGRAVLASTWCFNDNVGFSILSPLQYRNFEDSDIFDIGTILALPITPIVPRGDRSFGWTITPALAGAVGGSYDLAAGGLMWSGSLTSSLSYQFDRFVFTLANQVSAYEGVPIDTSAFDFETEVSQQILKNGLKVTYLIDRGFVDIGITHTRFLQDAAVDDYVTPMIGVGLRFGEAGSLRVGYKGDFGDDYSSHGGNVELVFAK
jgi:hypothetical protein